MSTTKSRLHHMSRRKKICFAAIIMTLSTVVSLIAAELSLRFLEKYNANQRQHFLDYSDTWRSGGVGPGGYLKEGFKGQVLDGYGGTVTWINNSQGFRNQQDFSKRPPQGTLRILSMGDSFTAGYRVDQNDTFSKQLEIWSTNFFGPTEVLVSCIESPYKGLQYLKQQGYTWFPHMVILGITLGNDIAQAYVSLHQEVIEFKDEFKDELENEFKNELEKLVLPDYCFLQRDRLDNVILDSIVWLQQQRLYNIVFKPPKSIASWYGNKEKSRLFDGVNGLGMYIKRPPTEIEDAYDRLFRILLDFKKFCIMHGIRFVIAIFPQRFQVQPDDWKVTLRDYSLRNEQFDLMLPNHRLQDFCDRNSIICIDPTEHMKKYYETTAQNLYLPYGDMHWNRYGHRVWLEGAKPSLSPLLREIFQEIGK